MKWKMDHEGILVGICIDFGQFETVDEVVFQPVG